MIYKGVKTAWLDLNTSLPSSVTTDPTGTGKAQKASWSVSARTLVVIVDNPAGLNTQKQQSRGQEGTGEGRFGR